MLYDYTNIEKIVADELTRRGIPFIAQYSTRTGFVLDFGLEGGLAIEVDGPCHDGSISKRRDRFRDRILQNEGWHVYRLNYSVVNDPTRLAERLSAIFGTMGSPGHPE